MTNDKGVFKPAFKPQRKSGKRKNDTLHVHLGMELYEKVGVAAAKSSVSMTEFVRQAVQFGIENLERQKS